MMNRADYVGNCLKPSFYAASRYKTIQSLKTSTGNGFILKRLGEVVEFVATGRKSHAVSDTIQHISVLHVNADCTIAFEEVAKFKPVSKGRECRTGELLFSKINPQIPRMAVIPDWNTSLICSNEFEIMKSAGIIGMYALCFLLKTEAVRNQITNLTSGTSSSHSRIKREQLADILIPIPANEDAKARIAQIDRELQTAIQSIYAAKSTIADRFAILDSL